MYHARRCLLTGNNWPQELGAFVSDSDSRPTHPHPWLAWSSPLPTPPTKRRDTQKRRPLVTLAVCFQMQRRNLQGTMMSPSRQTPFCIPASFHFFIIQFNASAIHCAQHLTTKLSALQCLLTQSCKGGLAIILTSE